MRPYTPVADKAKPCSKVDRRFARLAGARMERTGDEVAIMERSFVWLRVCHLFRSQDRAADITSVLNGFFLRCGVAFGQVARDGAWLHTVIIDGGLRAVRDVGGQGAVRCGGGPDSTLYDQTDFGRGLCH